MKSAFVVKPKGAELDARHAKLCADVIGPVCRTLEYELKSSNTVDELFKALDPVVSPLFTSSLVIVDLGLPPYDPAVMMAVGYRRCSGRPAVYIRDHSAHPKDFGLPWTQCISYDPDSLDSTQSQLQTAVEMVSQNLGVWGSHYGILELQIPIDDSSQAKYTYANTIAAQILGFDSPDDVTGKLCDTVDQQLMDFMPIYHREVFVNDQSRMMGQLSIQKSADFLAEVPIWFQTKHNKVQFRNRMFWPVITQHRFENGCWFLRQAIIDISRWGQRALNVHRENAIRLPKDFCPQAPPYDLFLSYSTAERTHVLQLYTYLSQLGLSVWLDCIDMNNQNPQGSDIAIAMQKSRALAVVVGENGLGPYQFKFELGVELDRRMKSGDPFLTLLLPGVNMDAASQLVPPEFWPKLQTRLVVTVDGDNPRGSEFTVKLVKFLVDILKSTDQCKN